MKGRRLLLLVLWVTLAGAAAWTSLERREDPPITSGVGVVLTRWPGADASRVESLVTRELEVELAPIDGLETVTSRSSEGLSVVVVQLDVRRLGGDVAPTMAKVRAALDAAAQRFPAGVSRPRLDEERFGAYSAIVALVPTGEVPPAIVARYGEALADRLRELAGTSAVAVFGKPAEEVRVTPRAPGWAAMGLETRRVAAALAAADREVATAALREPEGRLPIRWATRDGEEALRDAPLRTAGAGTLRVGDVARLRRTVADPGDLALVDGRPATVVAARLGPRRDIGAWTDAVERLLAEYPLPQGLAVEPIFLQRPYVAARLSALLSTLATGLVLVTAALGLFLGRAALAAALSLPLVLAASLAALWVAEVPLDQVSVAGLVVALGMVVDNAIVVTDHVRRARAAGATVEAAARGAVRELWVPLGASTLTTILAFTPIVLVRGRTGEFVGGLGVAVVIALGVSFVLAGAVTASLAARWAPPVDAGWRWGRGALAASLRHPRRTMALCALPAALGFGLAGAIPRAFFPLAERPQLVLDVRLPPGASLEQTRAAVTELEGTIRADGAVARVDWFVGRSAPPVYYNLLQTQDGSPHFAQAIVQLDSVEAVVPFARRAQSRLDRVATEAQVIVRPLQQGPPLEAALELRLTGPDLETLQRLGGALRERVARVSTVVHTRDDGGVRAPSLVLEPDEAAVVRAGLDLADLSRQLHDDREGVAAGRVLDGPTALPVVVRAPAPWDASTLRHRGEALPLEALVRPTIRPATATIAHRDGERVNVVRGYLLAGASASQAREELDAILAEDPVALPPGYTLQRGGEAEKSDRSRSDLLASVPVLLLAMFAVVVLALRSFRLAATVFVVALASVGLGLLGLRASGLPLGFSALMGLTAVVGIAINDAIVIATALRRGGATTARGATDLIQAHTARHVWATTITTVVGFVPLLVAGGPFWRPFAVAVAAGVGLATPMALFFVSSAVLLWNRRRASPSSA